MIYLVAPPQKKKNDEKNTQRPTQHVHVRYREIHAISLEEHNDLLASQGWDEGEFEAGIHRAKFFQQYAALVERELAKGEVRANGMEWKGGSQ